MESSWECYLHPTWCCPGLFPFPASAPPPSRFCVPSGPVLRCERKGHLLGPSPITHLNIQELITPPELFLWTKIWINSLFLIMMKIREEEKEAFALRPGWLVTKWFSIWLLDILLTYINRLRLAAVLTLIIFFSVPLCRKVPDCLFWWEAHSMAAVKASCCVVILCTQEGWEWSED